MISAAMTKRLGAVTIWGDVWELNALYDMVHKLSESSSLSHDAEEFVLALAYDFRKAKQGSRHQAKETFFEHSKDIFGVAVVCPVLLLQLAMLRGAASMHPMTDSDLALLLFLEAACQGAIREGFGQELGGSIWETTRSLRGGPHETSLSAIDGAVGYYLAKKTAVARQAALLPVMLALSPVIRMSMPSGPGRLSPAEMESFAGDVDTITASAKL